MLTVVTYFVEVFIYFLNMTKLFRQNKRFLGVKNVDRAVFGGVRSQWCGVRSRYVGFGAADVGFGGQFSKYMIYLTTKLQYINNQLVKTLQ